MTNNFRKVNVLRAEWDLPDYYDSVNFSRRSAFGIYCNSIDKRRKTNVEIKRWSLGTNNEIKRKAFIELKMLKHLNHKNIISHLNSFYIDAKLYIVTDVMQDNLNNIIRAQRLQSDDIRFIIFQIVTALNYLHTCGIVHGDLKPSDIGINKDMSIKIIDINAEKPKETDYVLTKWYRAPELLFAWKQSTERVDLWSLGCIMAEFLCGRIIFAGRDHLQQLKLILELLGTPSKDFFNPTCHFCILTQNLMTGEKFVRSLPFFRKKSFKRAFDECNDDDALDFLERLLILEPLERIDTKEALKHPYFAKYPRNDLDASVIKLEDEEIEEDFVDWIELIKQNVETKN
ncbi:hypothetical protein PVAND_010010 [Polypedilum vanderplanki]|uniref:Protein kinase domain-containing protein n=1 Tax=Polypedilum vanderplanki TaxID=319348 RepID=A0A9J6CF06_POLVA|nr:hypothetical protein PVAND_010010 [Polypedilum vanderplanki]